MSPADDATHTTDLGMPSGKPLDPEVIVPDGDAGLDEDESAQTDDLDEEGAPLDDEDDTRAETFNGAESDLLNATKSKDPVMVDAIGPGQNDGSSNDRPISSTLETDEKHRYSDEDATLGRAVRGLD